MTLAAKRQLEIAKRLGLVNGQLDNFDSLKQTRANILDRNLIHLQMWLNKKLHEISEFKNGDFFQ